MENLGDMCSTIDTGVWRQMTSVKSDEQREADAKDHQGNEEVAVGKDTFRGCTQGHRVPADSRNGLASTYRDYLCTVNAPGVCPAVWPFAPASAAGHPIP